MSSLNNNRPRPNILDLSNNRQRTQTRRPVVADLVNLAPQVPVNNQPVPVAPAILLSDDTILSMLEEREAKITMLNNALSAKRDENKNLFTHIQEQQGAILCLQDRISMLHQVSENGTKYSKGEISKLQKQVTELTQENATLKAENTALKEKLKKD